MPTLSTLAPCEMSSDTISGLPLRAAQMSAVLPNYY